MVNKKKNETSARLAALQCYHYTASSSTLRRPRSQVFDAASVARMREVVGVESQLREMVEGARLTVSREGSNMSDTSNGILGKVGRWPGYVT
jgi:hypothetical protein